MGAEMARDLPVPGRELKGIHFAMEYLTQQQNKRTAGISVSREPITAKGKRVVIIGVATQGPTVWELRIARSCSEAHQFEVLDPPPSRASSTPWPLWPCSFAPRMHTKRL